MKRIFYIAQNNNDNDYSKKIKILINECLSWQVFNISCETWYIQVLLFGKISAVLSVDRHICAVKTDTPRKKHPQLFFSMKIIKKIYIVEDISNSLYHQDFFFFLLESLWEARKWEVLSFKSSNGPACQQYFLKKNLRLRKFDEGRIWKHINLVSKKNWSFTYLTHSIVVVTKSLLYAS